jgi:hypothetical protein
MASEDLFTALETVDEASLYDEAFGLLEAARNFSKDCAPADDYESVFSLQLTSHVANYSEACVAWFAALGIVAAQ